MRGDAARAIVDEVADVISVERARKAMRLVGEVHELGVTTEAGRRHVVGGVIDLIGCALGGAVHDTGYGPGLKCGIAAATLVGFDREIIDVFQAHHTYGSDFNPFHRAVMARRPPGEVFTSCSTQLVDKREWERSPWITDYVRPARVDHFLGSMRLVGETAGVGFGFMRAARDRPFSDDDREMLHLVHLGIGAVYDVARARLAPRMRDTLDVLLEGATDKDIAARLGLSPHTVRQYVKRILRVYGVASRAQLIAKLR